ncbi:A/G-specific adenine glycosylase [Halomonas denitrificans]|nr:A/G-specific adenine glycosylase [Halomonas denitrificans]
MLEWWRRHGRHDLPWQHPRTPYRVWISEIMLQQTRVETVVGYFDRFMQRFPDVDTLARAPVDDVLACWSGLGYYARARNLHAAARRLVDEFGGEFPSEVDALAALPGIGRSTAAAIVAQGFDRRAPILDGNVKRVLARHAGIEGWPGRSAVERALWSEADVRTPDGSPADYTQAIMDLGATLCTPKRPACSHCPVRADCMARRDGRQEELPTPKPRKNLPTREQHFGLLRDADGRVLLERRPPTGIWGGLWCLPEVAGGDAVEGAERLEPPEPIEHVFSHFRLRMQLVHQRIARPDDAVRDREDRRWRTAEEWLEAGLPKPVRALLERL